MKRPLRPMHRRWSLPALVLLAAFPLGCTEQTAPPKVRLDAPRDFGYTVGSIVEHRVVVELPPDASVDPKLLPQPGPVNDWLDLRTIRWSLPDEKRLQLDLGYLILKGVKTPEPTAIPPLTLPIRRGDGIAELRTPDWPFTLMPVIPPGIADENVDIRGMAGLPRRPAGAGPWILTGSLLGVAVCALLIAVRRGLFPRLGAAPPFTAALRELGRHDRSRRETDRYAAGLKRIHRAIDETAGSAVFPPTLGIFLDGHPAFQPLRPEFERFFQDSQRYFFAAAKNEPSIADDWQRLVDFCRRCARAERGIR